MPVRASVTIVLLTAIHFHFAGFALPLLTGLAGRATGGLTACLAAGGVILGVPLVAVGITTTQVGFGSLLECIASWVTALAALLTAYIHLRLAVGPGYRLVVRSLWAVAALSLAGGMVLAALYGSRSYTGLAGLDIPWMRAPHGSADALGFGLAGTVGWCLAQERQK